MSYDAYRPRTTSVKLSLPLNGTIFTTTREVPAEKELPLVGTSGAQIGPAFADTYVIESTEVPNADGTKKVQTLIHARIPTEAEQLASNWQWASCSIGGQRFNGVTRTFIYLTTDFNDATPALASAMPISSGANAGRDSQFTSDDYRLTGRRASSSGMQLEPVFKVEVREYVKRVSMTNVGIDSLNGKPLFEITTLVHAGETVGGVLVSALFTTAQSANTFWGIQSTGFENSGQQLSAEWFALVSSQVVAGTFADGVVAVSGTDPIPSNDEYTWPPVLQHVDFMDWARREGGEDVFPLIVYSQRGYRGPCKTVTTLTWSKTAFVIPAVEPMLPNSIYYGSPYLPLSVPACLHGDVVCKCDIGNADPTYTINSGSLRVFKATNHTVWPDTIVAYDDQQPYRGGYLRTRKVAYKPAGSGGGLPVVTVPVPTGLAASPTATSAALSWTEAVTATGHIVEIATDALFANLIAYYRPLVIDSDTFAGLTAETNYWVRVSTLQGNFKSAPCAAVAFTTTAP